MSILTPLIPTLIFLALCIVPMSIIAFIFKRQTRNKKSPLNMNLLRSPGQSLQAEIDDLNSDILSKIIFVPVTPLTVYAIFVTQVAFSPQAPGKSVLVFYVIGAMAIIFSLSKDVYKMIQKKNNLRLGQECEVAVGQELSALISSGFRIFHDFPADNFNIDHVAIGPQGIFAIETKGRAKHKKQEKENWKLQFDGKALIFPGWYEKKPIQQAIDQANWLEKWIAKSTGERTKVFPVLAIPGWWIDRTGSSTVKVYNGKNPSFLAKGPAVLNNKQIQAAAFQIENKCRDVEARSYNI